MPANIDLGDYEIDEDSAGDLVIRDANDNEVFKYDETEGKWELATIKNLTAGSVSTSELNTNITKSNDNSAVFVERRSVTLLDGEQVRAATDPGGADSGLLSITVNEDDAVGLFMMGVSGGNQVKIATPQNGGALSTTAGNDGTVNVYVGEPGNAVEIENNTGGSRSIKYQFFSNGL